MITGAAGFIGSHLVRACLTRGDRVFALVRPGSGADRLADVLSDVELLHADLADAEQVRIMLDRTRPEVIYHAAANTRVAADAGLADAATSLRDNLSPLLGLVSAAATCKTPPKAFIRLGTIAEYGDNAVPYTETQCEKPRDSYGASMLAGTKYLAMLRPRLPFSAMTARLSLTYGPGQTGAQLVPYLIQRLLSGETARIGRPDDTRDFVHVADVVAALLLLADAPSDENPVVNISTGVATKVRDVALALADLTKSAPDQLVFGESGDAPMHLVNDPTLFHALYPWTARIGVADGLRDTVEWASASGMNQNMAGQDA